MRTDLRYSTASIVAGAGFAFLPLAFPDMNRILTTTSAITCLLLASYLVWPDIREFSASLRGGLKRMWPQYLMVAGGLLFFVGLVGFLQTNTTRPNKDEPSKTAEARKGGNGTPSVHDETGRLVSHAQFEKVREIESFFGGNDVGGVFDLRSMFDKNIIAQSARITLRRAGRADQFNYLNFTHNGQLVVWIKEKTDLPPGGRLIVPGMAFGPTGPNPNEGPRDVRFLVLTAQYVLATSKLTEFQNSVLIPENVKSALGDFKADFAKIGEIMLALFDDYLHRDERYFTDHWTVGSPFHNVLNNEFAGRTVDLKPGADRVLSAISAVWNINKKL